MTQYRLKKETFGISAGTIARKANNMDCYELPSPSGYNVFLENEVVENGSDFEKVEEPKMLAMAAFLHSKGPYIVDELFASMAEAVSFGEAYYADRVCEVIWPARFDDEGYLIMEGE